VTLVIGSPARQAARAAFITLVFVNPGARACANVIRSATMCRLGLWLERWQVQVGRSRWPIRRDLDARGRVHREGREDEVCECSLQWPNPRPFPWLGHRRPLV